MSGYAGFVALVLLWLGTIGILVMVMTSFKCETLLGKILEELRKK